jgi:hypothetical protein
MAYVPDRDGAMREVAQAYELIKSRLQFCDQQQLTTNLAQSLLNEALRGLHLALSVMNREPSAADGGSKSSGRSNMPHLFSPSATAGDVGGRKSQQRQGKRRCAFTNLSFMYFFYFYTHKISDLFMD